MLQMFSIAAGTLLLLRNPSSAAEAHPNSLPFGLDRLHWKMSRDDAVLAFSPLLDSAVSRPNAGSFDQREIDIEGYRWQSCVFEVHFFFAKSGLSTITLTERKGSESCARMSLDDLLSKYGDGDTKERHKYYNFKWQGPITDASYVWVGELGTFVGLYQDGGPNVKKLGAGSH